MEKQTGSKFWKEYIKAKYCYPFYLTYMQSASWEMPGWIEHKLESRLLGEISPISDMPLLVESEEELKRFLMKVKEENEKAGLKLKIKKRKIMAFSPITLWQIDQEKWKQWQVLFSWAPKSLKTMTAATQLKDVYSLEEKLGQT